MEENSSDKSVYGDFDISRYENKTFGMFGGNESLVTVNCKNDAAGAVPNNSKEKEQKNIRL